MNKKEIIKIIEEVKCFYPEEMFTCDIGKGARLACDVIKERIEEVLEKTLPEKRLLLETTGSLKNLLNLVAQMKTVANNWLMQEK